MQDHHDKFNFMHALSLDFPCSSTYIENIVGDYLNKKIRCSKLEDMRKSKELHTKKLM